MKQMSSGLEPSSSVDSGSKIVLVGIQLAIFLFDEIFLFFITMFSQKVMFFVFFLHNLGFRLCVKFVVFFEIKDGN